MTTEKGGAPTKFTEETREKILVAIRKGAPYEIACDYAGITYSCFNQWMHKAKDDHIPEFVEFFDRLKEAKGHTALIWLDKIDKAMNEGAWQAASWKLERRYHKHFSVHAPLLAMEERINKMEEKIRKQKYGKEAEEGREETEEEVL